MNALTRRQFVQGAGIAGLGLLAGCGRLLGQAQQPAKIARVGYLAMNLAPNPTLDAFHQGLRDLGYVDGHNLVIDYRATGQGTEDLRELASELVQLHVDVILAAGFAPARAAKDATHTIPIVVSATNDPVASGLVDSLARPGANLTGLSLMAPRLSAKRLELLKAAVPSITRVAVLVDTGVSPTAGRDWNETQEAAWALGIQVERLDVQRPDALPNAFESAVRESADALIPLATLVFSNERTRIVEFAATHRLPAMYEHSEFAKAGGLMSYGPSVLALSRRAATYVDKILKGTKPAELPVEQPMVFDFVINLRTAHALGLTIPQHVMLQATELIQ